MRKVEQFCSDVTSPNPLLLTSTPVPIPRRTSSRVTGQASPLPRPVGNFYDIFSADRFADQARSMETWEATPHGKGGAAAISLSSRSSVEEAGGNAKRHGHSRQFERPQSPFEGSPSKLLGKLPQRREEIPEATTDAASSSITRGHARHSGHHTRVLRPKGAIVTDGPEGSGPTSVKPKVRFRRHSHTHLGVRSQTPIEEEPAALIRETVDVTISRPEKRDPHNGNRHLHSNPPGNEFAGDSVNGQFSPGFRSLNKTHPRPPHSISRPNTSSSQDWSTDVSTVPAVTYVFIWFLVYRIFHSVSLHSHKDNFVLVIKQ